MDTQNLLPAIIGLCFFVATTMGLQYWAGVRLGWQPVVAALRAVAQLAAIALVLRGVFSVPWTAALFLVLMVTIAAVTSARRIAVLPHSRKAAPIAIVTAAVTVICLVFAARMLALTTENVIALGGIVTGNAMGAATLTGRRFMAASRSSRDQIEGWLALGARPAQAFAEVSRTSIKEMLIPSIDQTKNTGLVTLPGAFVGALMGGASPIEAAHFQLVVLISVMFAQTVVGVIETRILSRATTIVAD